MFDGVVTNPSLAEVRKALRMARYSGCDSIIAVGGGSVIDVAKVVYGCLCSGLEPEELAAAHGRAWLDDLSSLMRRYCLPFPPHLARVARVAQRR